MPFPSHFRSHRSALLAPLLAIAMALPVRAELMLNPTRVVMTRNQRAAQVELINDSNEPASYRISIVNRRMSETGDFMTIDTPGPGELFSGPMLTYSPRQVTLQPGSAQVVRLMIRKPEGLADGEYRSHLHFEKLPDAKDMTSSVESTGQPAEHIGVVLKTLIGASIPVIVRQGECEATVALSALALQPGSAPQLSFRIERAGCASVYGDLAASFTPSGGAEQLLAHASGVAVYTPNGFRRAALQLKLAPKTTLAHGQLHLRYRERAEAGGKLLAEAVLTLP
jgi:P pilus assembly chaperone PapD